jgi:UDP-N-acetylmuramate--alanine ligase
LIGQHNAENATAVVAVADLLGLPWDRVAEAMAAFRGTRRRFEVIGEVAGITVADDYAHHPTALRVTLAAARAHFRSPIWAVFQPHTAHRTMSLLDEFATAFADADHVIIAPTYRPAGREVDEDDPTVGALVEKMGHPDGRVMRAEDAVTRIGHEARPGDLVLVMGAGDIWTIERQILTVLGGETTGQAHG